MDQKNSNKNKYDFFIIGQGIAGSVLSLSLISAGFKVLVIDSPILSSSSKVAAGIWNPIVFKRLTKSWLADELVPVLKDFYGYWEKEFQIPLLQHRNIIKPFSEEQEKNLWQKKSTDVIEQNVFLDQQVYQNLQLTSSKLIESYSKVIGAGNLNIVTFLEQTQLYLEKNDCLNETKFDYKELTLEEKSIHYQDKIANQIIFCEGHLISENPYFNWIPMKPAKGETLIIKCKDIHLSQDIFNKGFFMMPLGNDLFKVGATYEWNELNDHPTPKGKAELEKKLETVLTSAFEIVSHQAGVRPSVIDRRPVIGHHPEHTNLYVFNGLGTKGVMIAPYFAKQFTNYFLNQTKIDEEVDVLRFVKKYYSNTI